MITSDAKEFAQLFRGLSTAGRPTMKEAMLVSPDAFSISAESAEDNGYMDLSKSVDLKKCLNQHAAVARMIEDLGVPVTVFPGLAGQPDAVFPNNAFATIEGSLIIGRMFHPVRQSETRREDIREFFSEKKKYEIKDLSVTDAVGELTGVLVIDRLRNVSFCGMSQRVDAAGLKAMHEAFGFKASFYFDLIDFEYHTNVVLSVLAGKGCVIYPGSFKSQRSAEAVIECYGDAAVVIDQHEKNLFVANCLSITPTDVLFSQTALDGLKSKTRTQLEKVGFKLHGVDVSELEKGGGSLRCLIAEIF